MAWIAKYLLFYKQDKISMNKLKAVAEFIFYLYDLCTKKP